MAEGFDSWHESKVTLKRTLSTPRRGSRPCSGNPANVKPAENSGYGEKNDEQERLQIAIDYVTSDCMRDACNWEKDKEGNGHSNQTYRRGVSRTRNVRGRGRSSRGVANKERNNGDQTRYDLNRANDAYKKSRPLYIAKGNQRQYGNGSRAMYHDNTRNYSRDQRENYENKSRDDNDPIGGYAKEDENMCSKAGDQQGKHRRRKKGNPPPGSTDTQNQKTVGSKSRKCMDMKSLKALVCEDSDIEEMLKTMISPESGFKELLMQKDIDPELLALVIQALGKSCGSTERKCIMKLMNIVCKNGENITFLIMRNLAFFFSKDFSEPCRNFINWLLSFFKAFQKAMPANACEVLNLLLPLIRRSVNEPLTLHKLDHSIADTLVDLEEENERFLSSCQDPTLRKQRVFEEQRHTMDPPEDFRSLTIFPTKEDIYSNAPPFLRPNLDLGSYTDVEHYLDVQFRLLREDFIRPLREGISKYKNTSTGNGKSGNISQLGMRVFQDVAVLYPKCTPYDVLHTVHFDETNFKNVKWEANKRWLMTGSLVCLVSKNFSTMLFAEVVGRDASNLREGLLDIRFDNLDDTIMRLRPSDTFVMFETNAYFEAYRHNLKKLQILNEETFPFQKYIIEVNHDIGVPQYLRNNPDARYDLRPLMIPMHDAIVAKINMENDDFYDYSFPDAFEHGEQVDILDNSSWPSRKELTLDDRQYKTIQNALTKEFVVIQGPPGTGKTFIGLRILQVLLHNRNIWCNDDDRAPILVVCYTNHALDQFLEDILLFTTRLVRVGGRCFCEKLEENKLSFLRREMRLARRNYPSQFQNNNVQESISCLRRIKADVERVERSISMANQVVIPEKVLAPYMEHALCESLKNDDSFSQRVETDSDGKLILDWLGLRLRGKHAPQWLHDQDFIPKGDESDNFYKIKVLKKTEITSKIKDNTTGNVEKTDAYDEDDFEVSRHVDEDDRDWEQLLLDLYESDEEPDDESSDDDVGWEILGGLPQRERYIQTHLKNDQMMLLPEISELPSNIWLLPVEKRWCLYRTWVARYALAKLEEIILLLKDYKEALIRFQGIRHKEDLDILRSASVVGMTTTGAAKYQELVRDLHPKIVIVEEAAEVLEAHIVTALNSSTEHLILIGDHKQLRPNPAVYELVRKYKLDISMFERMVNNKFPLQQLITQHRMQPDICGLLVPHIYEQLKCHISVTKYGPVLGVQKSLYFINHDFLEGKEYDSTSPENKHEVEFLIALCRYLIMQGYKPSEITILATYSMQSFRLKQKVSSDSMLTGVHTTPVDSYQGNENDIILVSFVRSNEEGKIGFLSVSNRVCVALSRAKKGLYCIGNFQQLEKSNTLWSNIVKYLEAKDLIGPVLRLFCQLHPTNYVDVKFAEDFRNVPEGGCIKFCNYSFEGCKHKCPLKCHPRDREHQELVCMERCDKKLKGCKHRCQHYCSDCQRGGHGPCKEKVLKELPCCHEMKVLCSVSKKANVCRMPCSRDLICGHKCRKLCGEDCELTCVEIIDCPSGLCGHVVKIKCFMKSNQQDLLKNCKGKCTKILGCGHTCQGSCGECLQGRIHMRCQKPCERRLVCGHKCQAPCALSCPPCMMMCDRSCAHRKCKHTCSISCKVCEEPCAIQCQHQMCNCKCWENCNIGPCNEPCAKVLKCNHSCIGFCGENCPALCCICHKRDLPECDSDSRFVQLDQCGHIIESNSFRQWLKRFQANNAIQMPHCFKSDCQKPLLSNRYSSNVLKLYWSQLSEVKDKLLLMLQQKNTRQKEVMGIYDKLIQNPEPCVLVQLQKVRHILTDRKLGNATIVTLKNILALLEIINSCCSEFERMSPFMKHVQMKSRELPELAMEIQNDILHFIGGILKEIQVTNGHLENPKSKVIRPQNYCSLQQLSDISQEVLRLDLLCSITKELENHNGLEKLDATLQGHFLNALEVLARPLPLSEEAVYTKVKPSIEELQKARGVVNSNLVSAECLHIVKPIDMSIGHWFTYQCKKHVYYTDTYGGDTSREQCPKCDSSIEEKNL